MKLICFDLDNTLINSEKAHVLSYNHALKKNGYKQWKFKDLVKLFGRPHTELIKILTGKNDRKVLKDRYDYLIEYSYKYARVLPKVKTTLKKLKRTYSLSIVSNTSHKSIIALLKGSQLNKELFDIIIGNDDVKKSKPYPDEILKAEKLVHHRADYIIGDSIYDVIAGKKARVKTIAILSGRYTRNQLKKYNPDFIITDISKLVKIL